MTAAWKTGLGNVMYFSLARNVDGQEPTATLEGIESKSGPLFHWEPDPGANAAGVATFENTIYNFPEPIHFDENDKLNAHIYNSQAAQAVTIVFTLYYRLT